MEKPLDFPSYAYLELNSVFDLINNALAVILAERIILAC